MTIFEKVYINHLSNEQDYDNRNLVDKPKDINQSNDILKGCITIGKNYLDGLDPKFKNSIQNIINVLNYNLNDIDIP